MMMMKKLFLAAALVCSGVGLSAHAQGMEMPAQKPGAPLPSPRKQAESTVAGHTVKVDYGAPSMRGRKIMGGLVPYTTWWRTGANEATAFETNTDLMVGGLRVPAGKYTLVTLPSEGEWQLVFCKHLGQWGTERFEADDLGKAPMKKDTLSAPQEIMSITFEHATKKSVELHVKWETTDVWVPMTYTK